MEQDAFTEFTLWLETQADEIAVLEAESHKALHKQHDEFSYRQTMEKKAEKLAKLHKEAMPLLTALPEEHRSALEKTLAHFSTSAATALRIGSIFYMSALLYPENYQKGEANDLEKFIESIRLISI